MHCFKGIKKNFETYSIVNKTTNFKTDLRTNPFQKRGDKYAKLQTNKGARYMMIAFIVLFLIMILRIFYIQAVGVVHNVNVKDLANEQHNKKVF